MRCCLGRRTMSVHQFPRYKSDVANQCECPYTHRHEHEHPHALHSLATPSPHRATDLSRLVRSVTNLHERSDVTYRQQVAHELHLDVRAFEVVREVVAKRLVQAAGTQTRTHDDRADTQQCACGVWWSRAPMNSVACCNT